MSEGVAETYQSQPALEPEPEPESESEYESEPEHSIPGAFKDEDEVLAEINGLKKKRRGKSKAKRKEVANTQEEIDSRESTKEEEDDQDEEDENETGQYSLLGATIAKARINGAGGRKVTPWPTPRIISYRSSMENDEGETTDSSESIGESAEEVAEKAASEEVAETESADIDENDYTDEEEDDEVFYDAEEG